MMDISEAAYIIGSLGGRPIKDPYKLRPHWRSGFVQQGGVPTNGYVLEDGVTFYVAEDNVTFYVQEN